MSKRLTKGRVWTSHSYNLKALQMSHARGGTSPSRVVRRHTEHSGRLWGKKAMSLMNAACLSLLDFDVGLPLNDPLCRLRPMIWSKSWRHRICSDWFILTYSLKFHSSPPARWGSRLWTETLARTHTDPPTRTQTASLPAFWAATTQLASHFATVPLFWDFAPEVLSIISASH